MSEEGTDSLKKRGSRKTSALFQDDKDGVPPRAAAGAVKRKTDAAHRRFNGRENEKNKNRANGFAVIEGDDGEKEDPWQNIEERLLIEGQKQAFAFRRWKYFAK